MSWAARRWGRECPPSGRRCPPPGSARRRGRTGTLPGFNRTLCQPELGGHGSRATSWTWPGSNRRPPPCRGGALPAAPQAHGRAPPSRTGCLLLPGQAGCRLPRARSRHARRVPDLVPSAVELSNHRSHRPRPEDDAGVTGFEPATRGFGVRCSGLAELHPSGTAERRQDPVGWAASRRLLALTRVVGVPAPTEGGRIGRWSSRRRGSTTSGQAARGHVRASGR